MALSSPVKTTDVETHESFLHVVARDFQWVLRVACILLAAATVVFMVTFWIAAIPTVILLMLCIVMLVMVDGLEHRTDATAPEAESEATRRDPEVVDPDVAHSVETTVAVEQRLTRICFVVVGGALVLALVLGAMVFDLKVLPLGLLVLGCYMVLVTAPVWMAWMETDMQEEVVRRRRW